MVGEGVRLEMERNSGKHALRRKGFMTDSCSSCVLSDIMLAWFSIVFRGDPMDIYGPVPILTSACAGVCACVCMCIHDISV
jgi:hypothetical protein